MSAEFSNVYDDQARADSYARLEFPGHTTWPTGICRRFSASTPRARRPWISGGRRAALRSAHGQAPVTLVYEWAEE